MSVWGTPWSGETRGGSQLVSKDTKGKRERNPAQIGTLPSGVLRTYGLEQQPINSDHPSEQKGEEIEAPKAMINKGERTIYKQEKRNQHVKHENSKTRARTRPKIALQTVKRELGCPWSLAELKRRGTSKPGRERE